MNDALMIVCKSVGWDDAKQRIAEIFEVRACPCRDLCGRQFHSLNEVEQHRRRLLHGILMLIVGGLCRRNDDAAALKGANFDRVGLNMIALIDQLVTSIMH